MQAGLAAVRYCTGDVAQAAALYRESLQRSHTLAFWPLVVNALHGLVGVAAETGQPEVGGRLLGAAEGIATSMGSPMFVRDHLVHDRALAALCLALGGERSRCAGNRPGPEHRGRGRGGSRGRSSSVVSARRKLISGPRAKGPQGQGISIGGMDERATSYELGEAISVEQRVALVTGAAQGIGQQTATVLAERGYAVVLNDLRPAEETMATITQRGGTAINAIADVGDETAVVAMIAEVMARFGRIDVLVNNAGISLLRPAESTTLAEWERVMRVNLTRPFLTCREAGNHMLARGEGAIVNIASVAGLLAVAGPLRLQREQTRADRSYEHSPRVGWPACGSTRFAPAG